MVSERSGSITEQLFRASLQDLISQFEEADSISNGALATLLDNLEYDEYEDALQQLDSSGLIDVVLLDSIINDAATYEDLLLQAEGADYVDDVIEEETGDVQLMGGGPFWGKRPGNSLGTVGGINPGDPCYEMYEEHIYRFWIRVRTGVAYSKDPVPCP